MSKAEATSASNAASGDRLQRYRSVKQLLGLLPYGAGAKAFAWVARNPLVQGLAKSHRGRLREFMRDRGLTAPFRETFARYLVCNHLAAWRLSSLARCSDTAFSNWVTVVGEQHFSALREAGKPVILCNSHFGSGKAVMLALIRSGHVVHSLDRQDVFAFFGIQSRGRVESINLGDREQSFMLKQVSRARKVLLGGGILHIAGDGLRGQSGREIAFLGRARRFPTSVAELALLTGAAVVPVFGPLNVNGQIRLEFLPPLNPPEPGLSREASVDHLILQYRDLLEARWLADPGSIFKSELTLWHSLPRLSSVSGTTG